MRTPAGRAVRPTPARVKEALFSILADRIASANVLDLFAGTGALGFEALSRGAARATFVDVHRPTADAVRSAARELGIADRVDVVALSAERAAQTLAGRYDVVFADPPYAQPFPATALAALHCRGAIDVHSLIVYEHSSRAAAPAVSGFVVDRTAIYGEVALSFVRVAPA